MEKQSLLFQTAGRSIRRGSGEHQVVWRGKLRGGVGGACDKAIDEDVFKYPLQCGGESSQCIPYRILR